MPFPIPIDKMFRNFTLEREHELPFFPSHDDVRLKSKNKFWNKNEVILMSPGLVVMGGDLYSEGRGFKSRHHILDGQNISPHVFVVRSVMYFWKDKNKWKRGRGWSIFLKNSEMFDFSAFYREIAQPWRSLGREESLLACHSTKNRLFLQGNLFNFILRNNLSYCWMGELSGKPVTPLYLKSSMAQLTSTITRYLPVPILSRYKP